MVPIPPSQDHVSEEETFSLFSEIPPWDNSANFIALWSEFAYDWKSGEFPLLIKIKKKKIEGKKTSQIEPQRGDRAQKLGSYWCFYNSHQNHSESLIL